jgi:hypothetical protein
VNRHSYLWAIALYVLSLSSWAQKPPVGNYVYQGGGGELRIESSGKFSIDTVGANAHTCSLEGNLSGERGLIADSACVLTISRQGSNIGVADNDHSACRDYCGVRAGFKGTYFSPSPACTAKRIAANRKRFKLSYDKKAFSSAVQILSPILVECADVLHHFDKAFIRNDLALAQLRSGDAAGCLVTLQPLKALGSMSNEEVREIPEPTFVDIYLRIARVTRTNLSLCNAAVH